MSARQVWSTTVGRWAATQPWVLIAWLVSVDVVITVIHVIDDQGRGSWWSLETDRGVGGLLLGIKLLLAAWLMLRAHRSSLRSTYLIWSAAFLVATLDGWLEIHENGGYALARWLDLPTSTGVRGDDIAELVVWALLGAPLLVMLVRAYRHEDGTGQYVTRMLLALMGLLAFFAAAMDVVHMAVRQSDLWWEIVGVIEEGGEMVVTSLLLGGALAVGRRHSALADPPVTSEPALDVAPTA